MQLFRCLTGGRALRILAHIYGHLNIKLVCDQKQHEPPYVCYFPRKNVDFFPTVSTDGLSGFSKKKVDGEPLFFFFFYLLLPKKSTTKKCRKYTWQHKRFSVPPFLRWVGERGGMLGMSIKRLKRRRVQAVHNAWPHSTETKSR